MWFYWIAVILFTAYLLTTISVFRRIPKSISETYYLWKSVDSGLLFTYIMWTTGVLILIYWLEYSTLYDCQFLAFTSIAGMVFVGGACAFKETLTKSVHFTSAGIWAGSAVTFFLVNGMYHCLVVGGVIGIIGLLLNRFKNFTFWAELACVASMMVGLYLL